MLVARRQMKWQGRGFAPGQPLVPQPQGRQRQRLTDGLFVVEVDDDTVHVEAQSSDATGNPWPPMLAGYPTMED